MDKIKGLFGALKKIHFWLFACLVFALVPLGWYLASSSLSKEFEENQKTVMDQVDGLDRIPGESSHPNDRVVEGIHQVTARQREEVAKVWEVLYAHQKEHVLVWPDRLGTKFQEYVRDKKFGDPIPSNYLTIYQAYVREAFRDLPKIVDAREIDDSALNNAGSGGFGHRMRMPMDSDAGGTPIEEDYVVDWNQENFVSILRSLPVDRTPEPLRVWITQEDMWVYQTLLRIISNTNQRATGPHNAAVKVINALEVGQLAAYQNESTGRLLTPGGGGAAGMGDGGMVSGMLGGEQPVGGEMGRGDGVGAPPGVGGPGALGGGYPEAGGGGFGMPSRDGQGGAVPIPPEFFLEGRYLDDTGQPIPGDQVEQIVGFKRLPIRMDLEMQEVAIPALIANCANAAALLVEGARAALPVEVVQVRINPDESTSSRGGYAGGGGMMMRSMPGSGRTSSFKSSGTGMPGDGQSASDASVVRVVIHGYTYIFKHPDTEALKAAGDVAGADSSTPPPST